MSESINLTVEEAIEQIRQGRQVILVDDEDRENEGDLCMAADRVTPEGINFMARYGRGLVCLTITAKRASQLGLSKMAERNQSRFGTNFYTSIEAREGVTTGISAADRARTVSAAMAADATPMSVVSPGHVFPICARDGGVLVRAGQTEGSVDLARLAGLQPAGVICEIMKDDGDMARRPDLEVFAREHGLGIVTIEQLIRYRLERESQIELTSEAEVVPAGVSASFRLLAYTASVSGTQYLALALGDLRTDDPVLVRMHRASVPTDVFGVAPSKTQTALQMIERAGRGVFVYVLPPDVDLADQVSQLRGEAPATPRGGPPELREFGLGAQVLATLGVRNIRLMTDNPMRIVGLEGFGLSIVERVALQS
ncbi:MAG: 3,4-dihydroxy-2-butanone-4-phosphate synthase [Myxococcales bacterium]|nr:3,4-dihydroxy-2-butanone-4-phosphate synthase [Myxococcales bacterium]